MPLKSPLRNAILALPFVLGSGDLYSDVIGVSLVSYHHESPGQNGINPGIFWAVNEVEGQNLRIEAGSYWNSEESLSQYVGIGHEDGRLGVMVGIVTGYKLSKVLPYIAPYITLPVWNRLSAEIVIPPNPVGKSPIAFRLRWDFRE